MGTDHRGLQGRSRWMHGWSPVAFVMSRVAEEDLRVIWTSAPIAVSVTAVRGEFTDEFKQELVNAYLSFRTEDPDSWAQFQRMFVDPTTVWVAARDEDYDELRALARNVRHLNLID